MASKVLVRLIDDLDGSDATQTVGFGLDGVRFEIDLTDPHAEELRSSIDKFVKSARRVGGKTKTRHAGTTVKSTASKPTAVASTSNVQADNATIRAWAAANGVQTPKRGRIPGSVVDQFMAAQEGSAARGESE